MPTTNGTKPRPRVVLLGCDGNAFSILGRCRRAALKSGWTREDFKQFIDEATKGDYDHLLGTVMKYFDPV